MELVFGTVTLYMLDQAVRYPILLLAVPRR